MNKLWGSVTFIGQRNKKEQLESGGEEIKKLRSG